MKKEILLPSYRKRGCGDSTYRSFLKLRRRICYRARSPNGAESDKLDLTMYQKLN
jgi:hypothetical protein